MARLARVLLSGLAILAAMLPTLALACGVSARAPLFHHASLVAAEAGDRLSAALQGADDTTKAAVAAALGDAPEARIYRRFDYRHSDVMGSGRYFYASKPKGAALPL